MEDNNTSKDQPNSKTKGKTPVIELTPDMEIPEDNALNIYDLTDALDSPGQNADDRPPAANNLFEDPAQTASGEGDSEHGTTVGKEDDARADAFEVPEPEADDFINLDDIVDEVMAGAAQNEAADRDAAPSLDDAGFDPKGESLEEPELSLADDELIDLTDISAPQPVADAPLAEEEAVAGEDDDLIELDDIVEPAQTDIVSEPALEAAGDEEDELIDLTDIVADTSVTEASGDAGDGELIDLTEIVAPGQDTEAVGSQDDELIDLTEVVAPAGDSADTVMMQEGFDDDDDILDLSDMVEGIDASGEHSAPDGAADEASEENLARQVMDAMAQQNDVIHLDEVLGRSQEPAPSEHDFEFLDERDFPPPGDENAISIGMAMDEAPDQEAEKNQLSDEEIEKAIERIIRTKYAQSIEQLIASAVEKVVTREINSIKRSLLEDDDPLE